MVNRKNIDKKFALISVYKKNKLKYLCKNLIKHNYEFISTGSTCLKIRQLGFNCLNVSELTNFKEILDGRVKTLNSKIYGSILYNRDINKHVNEFKKLDFPKIDIVIINLYPFEEFIQKKIDKEIIEMIDIGGISLIRAASKNYKDVTILSEIDNYSNLVKNLNKNKGLTDLNFRKSMATKSFKLTSSYDKLIYEWLNNNYENQGKISLKYGENPDQTAYIKSDNKKAIDNFKISGKEISYNNIIDVDSGLNCMAEFNEPTCIIIKHTNPCGVASSNSITTSFLKAFRCDKQSAFGGVVILNRAIDQKLAKQITSSFFEVVVAPNFNKNALKILKERKKLILLKIKKFKKTKLNFRSTIFGNLYQNESSLKINNNFLKNVSLNKLPKKKILDLIFSLKVAKHLKSNSIVLSKNKQTMGLGSGETSRVEALKIAISKKNKNFGSETFVCASDGFFPFNDSIKLLIKNKCEALAQPKGSINDKKVIEYSNKNMLPLYFIKNRLFKH